MLCEEELESTVAELESSNRSLAILKAEKDATKGAFFPVLNLTNRPLASDKARDKNKELHDLESALKELLVIPHIAFTVVNVWEVAVHVLVHLILTGSVIFSLTGTEASEWWKNIHIEATVQFAGSNFFIFSIPLCSSVLFLCGYYSLWQNSLRNFKCICSSQPYLLLKDQLMKAKACVIQNQALFEKLQVVTGR